MIKYLIPFLLVFTVVTAYSQKVKGKITDIEGNPLPFASVFIKNTGKGTNANSEGVYSLKLAPGKYKLACQYVGYKKEEISISINNDDQAVSYTHLRAHETVLDLVCRLLLEKKKYHTITIDSFLRESR